MDDLNKFSITLTADEKGGLTAYDSSTGETESWDGVIVILGDENSGKFAHWSWGRGKSIVFGMYAAILQARENKSQQGDYHRSLFAAMSRMIIELYEYFRMNHRAHAEKVIERWTEEDETACGKNETFH